jgi:hypothetical protein
MAENKHEAEMISAITKHEWNRWSHIEWSLLSFSRATAYNHNLDKLDTIKEAFENNRTRNVNYLVNKWIKSDNATLQIAAFKIVSEPDDHKRLNQTYVEQKDTTIDLSTLSTDDLKQMLKDEQSNNSSN